jgi:localization factor PodJL
LRAQTESRLAAIQQQVATTMADAIRGPAESVRRDIASLKEIQTTVDRRTQDTFEAVYGTIEEVVNRLATFEDELRDRSADKPEWGSKAAAAQLRLAPAMVGEAPALVPSAAPVADRAAPAPAIEPQGDHDWGAVAPSDVLPAHPLATTGRLRFPAVPDFACDASLQPAWGARGVRVVTNAIDRIAASEAVNGVAKPAETPPPVRAQFVAAARRAARAVGSAHKETPRDRFEKSDRNAGRDILRRTLFGMWRPRAKSLVLGVGVVLLILGALRLTLDLSHNPKERESARPITQMEDAAQPGGEAVRSGQMPLDPPPARQDANLVSPALPGPFNANPLPVEAQLGQATGWGVPPDVMAQTAISAPAATQALAVTSDMYAFLPIRNVLLQGPAIRGPASSSTSSAAPDLMEMALPPAIDSKALLAAASAGDPGASYEIALRLAEGRNAQDLALAAAWLERAARNGFAPAQFRLGSMYEKGLGIEKDLVEAHRLYVAAADKGHAKAMHNLAVLYAGGFDGKPDYVAAAHWFHRAAAHGIVDSQYNLAILYARGVGVERNLAESYKWFALAAKGGDKDAARKRDEIAMRLDPKQLDSAKLSAESFVTVPQPDEATAIKAPAGGWNEVAVAATTKSKALVRPERFSGKQDPRR